MKRYRVIILFFCLFVFYGDLGFSAAEDDLKTKVETRLLDLKRAVLEEQVVLRTLNEKLLKENELISQENNQLKDMLNKTDSGQQKNIQELEQKVAQLNGIIENKAGEIAQKDEEISNLQQLADNANKQVKKLEQMNITLTKTREDKKLEAQISSAKESLQQEIQRLTNENGQAKLALEEANNSNAILTKQVDILKNELESKPKERIVYQTDPNQEKRTQELEQKIAELNESVQEKTQQIIQKDREISDLRQGIDNAYNRVKNILDESYR